MQYRIKVMTNERVLKCSLLVKFREYLSTRYSLKLTNTGKNKYSLNLTNELHRVIVRFNERPPYYKYMSTTFDILP